MARDPVQSFCGSANLKEGDASVVFKILSTLDPNVTKAWIEKVEFRNGKLAGTFNGDIGAHLTYNEFRALYEALGYNFNNLSLWQDWWCYGAEGCKRQYGYTCDPDRCP